MNQPNDNEMEKERKEKGTSPKDLNLAESEQDKVKGGTVEKQGPGGKQASIEKQATIEKQ